MSTRDELYLYSGIAILFLGSCLLSSVLSLALLLIALGVTITLLSLRGTR